jgi:precorrin-6B methylase 1
MCCMLFDHCWWCQCWLTHHGVVRANLTRLGKFSIGLSMQLVHAAVSSVDEAFKRLTWCWHKCAACRVKNNPNLKV